MEQYKDYFISATLANFSYSSSDQLVDLWVKKKDSNEDNIFNGVEKVPECYNDDKTGAFAFSFKKEKTLYFVFRGTNDFQDVMIDLNFILVPFDESNKKCKVHRGFMTQFNVLKEPILKTVCENAKNIETIKCIGHSLGGALATLFAGYIGSLHLKVDVLCHTFGSPRVGNKNYAIWFNQNVSSSNCVRIMNKKDPVAQIPISVYFHHVSDAKCIMSDLTVKNAPERIWYSRLSNLSINCCKPVLAHSCEQYIEVLMKLYLNFKNIDNHNVSIQV